ncbi:hypothetical protein GF323_01085 [Candidatus Woesearchaeota archaeon]|nr:hypothetical protein [Candidatus Woesearchaeota archaeon]
MAGLREKEIKGIREELGSCQRPIFLFHDDADGLCSFLLFYRYAREGKGVVVKSKPSVDEKFARNVENYDADKVFILDLAVVKQEFVDAVKRPVVWIDHHKPIELDNVAYFNPRKHKADINYPATNICYDVVKQDIWIAMAGCVGDWHMPYFRHEFCKRYPDLLDKGVKSAPEALFNSELGKLVKILNFILKGKTKEAMKCVKILTRVKEPYEILRKETSQGRYIHKRFEKVNENYEKLLKEAEKAAGKDNFLVFTYSDREMSFTGELSNELLYKYPEKVIIIAREKEGDMRMSLRSSKVVLPSVLEKALSGIEGYGGGHEYACGACVKKDHFGVFLDSLKKEIDSQG